ncbi:hypothetical protein ANACOL_03222 [Anaerotruncus colihominis DSM 17241]|uniref:Uncharacterized protein n=1 Tax=Anaerotruncus colihominis DSM 17241 TaxID=445972 RepID=B0PEJ4_9FIRM|nr:hypothetical protein ANACOL_03222 [Anaerotruncus colihominis DSM 17241]
MNKLLIFKFIHISFTILETLRLSDWPFTGYVGKASRHRF